MTPRVRRIAAASLIAAAIVARVTPLDAFSNAAREGARYIASQQTPTGSFFAANYPADGVADAIVALVAGGAREPIPDALAYLRRNGPARADERAAYAGRIVMGLVAAGRDPRAFGGVDYVAKITSRYDPVSGRYDNGIYAGALAMLGVLAAGEQLPDQALTFLRANQCTDGGFGHEQACTGGADVDSTAIVLSVLVATGIGPDDATRARARTWLRGAQNDDGGFPASPTVDPHPTNANSTGLALSAIAALGEDPAAWGRGTATPLTALRALQRPSGGFTYAADSPQEDPFATVQAVPGAAGLAYPIRAGAHTGASPAATGAADASSRPGVRPAASGVSAAQQQTSPTPRPSRVNNAGLVIQRQDGTVSLYCVRFPEAQITGYELLRRSGVELVVQDFGGGVFICKIQGEGQDYPREPCTPPCPSQDSCTYWGYYRFENGAWRFNDQGVTADVVRNLDIEGWRFGPHSLQGGNPPLAVALEEVCPRRELVDGASAPPSPPASPSSRAPYVFAAGLLLFIVIGLAVARRFRGAPA